MNKFIQSALNKYTKDFDMDFRFLHHNTHIETPEAFMTLDPHLKLLSKQPLALMRLAVSEEKE